MTMPPDGARLDLPRLTSWLGERVPALAPPLTATVIEGGLSNLTFLLTDAASRRWVLRRPPWHSVLPSAHDVLREHRVVAALASTDVPVPHVVGAEEDPVLLGAPFFVMGYVDGWVLRTGEQAEAGFSVRQRRELGLRAVAALASLHQVRPDGVGLGDLARSEGYVQRQLRRWWRQWQDSRTRDQPLAAELHSRLTSSAPAQTRTGIVHGDFRIDNLIVDRKGEVRAVLDWELCTLGDPLADLGNMLAYWVEPGETPYQSLSSVTACPGFPSRAALLRCYADVVGDPVDHASFYIALGRWKVAIILEGVYARYTTGAMAGSEADLAGLLHDADMLFQRALEELDRA